jgi:5-methylcytosine-specific restriction endonuclease McrA
MHMTKICNACKIIKTLDNFNTKPGRKNQRRYNHICKTCQSEKTKQKNRRLKDSFKIIENEKICNKCKLLKSSDQFTKDTYQKTGLSKLCLSCQSQYYQNNRSAILKKNLQSQRKHKLKNNLRKMVWALKNKSKIRKANQDYYKRNVSKIMAYNKKWTKENVLASRNKGHRYRVRKRGNTIQKFTKAQLEQRMSVFGFQCAYCGGSFDHIDHVKPISKGGYHCLSNLRPACRKCNLEKHNKSLLEWLCSKQRTT